MISVDIPGWGDIEIENILLDLNGTIATDGKIAAAVKEKINALAGKAKIFLLTADTQGTAAQETQGLVVELVKIAEQDSAADKVKFLKTLDLSKTTAVGNGSNDQFMLKEAALGIAVLGDEGMSLSAMKNADLVVKNISDALNLFLHPKRLIATLRE